MTYHSQLFDLLESLDIPLALLERANKVLRYNRAAKDLKVNELLIDEIDNYSESDFKDVFNEIKIRGQKYFIKRIKFSSDLFIFTILPETMFPAILKEHKGLQEQVEDLDAIFDSAWDIIYVVDAEGVTLKISSSCERILGLPPAEFIGKSVHELEEQKYFYPSITKLSMKQKDKVSDIQMTKNGKRLFTTSNPIFDKEGNIVRFVNTAKDITESTKLQEEIEFYKYSAAKQEEELLKLKKKQTRYETRSKQIERVYDTAIKVARTSSTVLITGDTGVGKSHLANFIHQQSERDAYPFVTVHCGTIPASLIESELFGYEPGAFTGANKKGKSGMVELAEKGTLFLDEIGELSLNLQVKLLQLLQSKTFRRVGANADKEANVRIIAATNQDLERMVKEKSFRSDLYYRLSVIPIHIPPLKERKDDIVPLIFTILNYFNTLYETNKTLSSEAFNVLTNYDWPGNVREIENVIERLIIITEENTIEIEDLPENLLSESNNGEYDIKETTILPLGEVLEKAESSYLEEVSRRYNYNTVEIAKILKVHQSTISRKLSKYGINKQN